jgi:hypothetical protein
VDLKESVELPLMEVRALLDLGTSRRPTASSRTSPSGSAGAGG